MGCHHDDRAHLPDDGLRQFLGVVGGGDMRNVSGYLTDDGHFFTDKKEAEAHERMASMTKHIESFVIMNHGGSSDMVLALLAWEKYRAEVTK